MRILADWLVGAYLTLPFIAGFGDLCVRVTHHSDQHVDEEDTSNADVTDEKDLGQ